MKTVYLKDYQELENFIRTKANNFPCLAYVVFKKYYKERSFELNLEILLKNQETIISMIQTKIDESDVKKMKYILSKIEDIDVKVDDKNKKAFSYLFEVTNLYELHEIYKTCNKGLQDIQFSDFYA